MKRSLKSSPENNEFMRFILSLLILGMLSCNKKESETTSDTIVSDSSETREPVSRMLIIPGKSIGNISIGMRSDDLEPLLGKPDLSDAAMGKAWLTWFSKVADSITGNELNIYTTYKDNTMREKVVRQVRITSPEFKTADGLSTGKSLAEFQKIYPNLELSGKYDTETANPITVYDVKGEGIAFEFEDNFCVGIIIHQDGKKVSEEYLSFHPDMVPM
jgi:hypothetical protein